PLFSGHGPVKLGCWLVQGTHGPDAAEPSTGLCHGYSERCAPAARRGHGIYAYRAAGGAWDHHDPDQSAAPGTARGARGGADDDLLEQPEADRGRADDVRQREQGLHPARGDGFLRGDDGMAAPVAVELAGGAPSVP